MVLSVGSLLGQNILDALENRRDKVFITGLDMGFKNARLFRCDQVFISPGIDEPEFESFVLKMIDDLNPNIIFAGRDHDTLFLAKLVEKYPELIEKVIVGKPHCAELMNDKAKSYDFAQKYNLPFAKSFIFDKKNFDEAKQWAKECGFPLIVKPREGFGSLGIRIVSNSDELETFQKLFDTSEYMIQEILELDDKTIQILEEYKRTIHAGIPFNFHIPVHDQYAAQGFISRDGSIKKVFTNVTKLLIGRAEGSIHVDNDELARVGRLYTEAIAKEGWRGFFNLQVRKVGDTFVAHEMNGRMSGASSARRWIGYDEIRIAIEDWISIDIGSGPDNGESLDGIVQRSLTDYYISKPDMDELSEKGKWAKTK